MISIDYKDDYRNWMETYSYSSSDELIRIEDFRSSGRRYEVSYENSQVKEIVAYSINQNKIIFRDSIAYNANRTINKIYKFSINAGENVELSSIYEFEYDHENKVSRKSTYFVKIGKYTSIDKYFWNGANIARVECYNGEEEMHYEYFYDYDNKNNYQKEIPTSIADPINWSNNNVTRMNWNDYLGNLDIICRPCVAKYRYNSDHYPIFIKFNWGRVMTLRYE